MKKAIKAGKLTNGFERGKGSVVHWVSDALVNFGLEAICGARPAIAWCEREHLEVNCQKCLKKAKVLTHSAD